MEKHEDQLYINNDEISKYIQELKKYQEDLRMILDEKMDSFAHDCFEHQAGKTYELGYVSNGIWSPQLSICKVNYGDSFFITDGERYYLEDLDNFLSDVEGLLCQRRFINVYMPYQIISRSEVIEWLLQHGFSVLSEDGPTDDYEYTYYSIYISIKHLEERASHWFGENAQNTRNQINDFLRISPEEKVKKLMQDVIETN